MIKDSLNLALKNLKKRKLRALLTLLGIIISIATIFTLISISIGLQGAVEEQFRLLGSDKFFIQPRGQLGGPGTGGAVELTERDADIIKKVPGVKEVSVNTFSSSKIEFGDETRYATSIGVDLDQSNLFIETSAYETTEGRLLTKDDSGEVMIGSQYKDNNFFRKPVRAGDKIKINDVEFKVRGILKTVGNPQDDRNIIIPMEDFRSTFNIIERVDMIIVQVNEEDDLNDIVNRVEKKLLDFRNLEEENRDFTILTPEELLESFGAVLNIISVFLFGVAAISLLVGGIGIANTMYTSVLERTKEIGIMKSIGAKNSDIMFIFMIESALLGLIGGASGILIGISISKAIEYIAINQLGTTLLKAATPFYLIIGCLVFSIMIGVISGTLPARQASSIKPVDALRYE